MCDTCTSLLLENGQLTEEVSGLLDTTRRQGREIVGLKNELRKQDIEDPSNAAVQVLLQNWLRLTGRGARTVVEPGGKRWKVAKAALKREGGQQRCLESIEGYALLPYVGAHGRQATGKQSQRFDDIEHSLGDETKVDRGRKYRAQALGASADMLFEAYEAANATAHLYLTASIGRNCRDRYEQLSHEEQAAHRIQVARTVYGDNVIDLSTRRSAA